MDPGAPDVETDVPQRSDSEVLAAFSSFYRAELVGQVRAAALVTGSRTAAQDLVHDAFVEVLRKWDTIESPGPYLQRAVLYRCRDLLRHERVVRRHRASLRPDEYVEIDAPLFDALARLPFNHRAAIVLRYYLQLTEAEIADRLACPTGSVGPWIRRGLDRLAEDLRLPPEAP